MSTKERDHASIVIDHGLDVQAPKPCSEYFTPPAKKHMPRTSTDIMVMNIESLGKKWWLGAYVDC